MEAGVSAKATTTQNVKILATFYPFVLESSHGVLGILHLVFKLRLAGYVLRETTWLYAFGVAAFCLLLSIDTLTVWASYLLEQDATLLDVGRLMLYQTPFFLHISLPIAAVFAVLLATGRLAKDSELKAAYSLGVPPFSLLGPLLFFGLMVSGVAVVNNGYLEPRGEIAQEELVASFYNARPSAETQRDASFTQEEGVYYAARIRANEEDRTRAGLSGVLIYRNDGALLTAQSGTWDSVARTWTLDNVEVLPPEGLPREETQIVLPFDLENDAATNLAESEKLTLGELWGRIQSAGTAGRDLRGDLFNFHQRLADAFSAAIFVLIAGALGLHIRGRSAGFAWTIVLLVLFFALWTLSENLFEQGVFSPIVAAWFTSAVIGLVGFVVAAVRLR